MGNEAHGAANLPIVIEARSAPQCSNGRLGAYLRVLTILLLNIPVVASLLLSGLSGMDMDPLVLLYAAGVILGYYVLPLLVIVSVLSAVVFFAPRVLYLLTGLVFTLFNYYLFLDNRVYAACRFDLDLFWLNYLWHDPDGIGLSMAAWVGALLVLVGLAALELGAFRLAGRLRPRAWIAPALASVSLFALASSQVIHVAAYERNQGRITSLTPQLPFYMPVTSHGNAVKFGDLLPLDPALGEHGIEDSLSGSIRYPLCDCSVAAPVRQRPLNVVMLVLESWRSDAMSDSTTPNICALARESSLFRRHFSSGNATTPGIFGLFYGLYGTYWPAVKANNARLHNPLLIDLMQEAGYEFGIYADSHFDRHKIKDAIFRDITVHEQFAGADRPTKELDMANEMNAFLREHRERPFMLFAFYKASHYSYYYPDSFRVFTPVREINPVRQVRFQERQYYLNDYHNAVHFDDALIGGFLKELEALQLKEQTVIVVTGDHGEEFDDDGTGCWGHTSNFTRYQTQVPFVLYYPGRAPRVIDVPTSHVDLAATLIPEIFGVRCDGSKYSNGLNLFHPLPRERALVVASNVCHAFVIGDAVYEASPVHMRSYQLDDMERRAGHPRSDLIRVAAEEIGRFSRAEVPEVLARARGGGAGAGQGGGATSFVGSPRTHPASRAPR